MSLEPLAIRSVVVWGPDRAPQAEVTEQTVTLAKGQRSTGEWQWRCLGCSQGIGGFPHALNAMSDLVRHLVFHEAGIETDHETDDSPGRVG